MEESQHRPRHVTSLLPFLPPFLDTYPVAKRGERNDDEKGAEVLLGLHDVGQEGDRLDGLSEALEERGVERKRGKREGGRREGREGE